MGGQTDESIIYYVIRQRAKADNLTNCCSKKQIEFQVVFHASVLLLTMCGFIAQLVEHHTGIAVVTGSNPVEALVFSVFCFPIA